MKNSITTSLLVIGLAGLAAGCASHPSGGTAPQALYNPAIGYTPPVNYSVPVYSPTVIHFTGSGMGAIQAGLMNNMRR
jgi:hypothetical protein